MHSSAIDNELDVKSGLHRLWRGKKWVGLGLCLGLIFAWSYAMLAPQKWVSVAQFSRPDLTKITRYYQELSKLTQLSSGADPTGISETTNVDSVIDTVYQTFLQQLSSVDNRRHFWLAQQGAEHTDPLTPVMLERQVASIQLTLGDKLHGTIDTLTLTADNPTKSSELLKRYLMFTDQQVMQQIQQELTSAWQSEIVKLEQQIAVEKNVAQANSVQQATSLKGQASPSAHSQTDTGISQSIQNGPVVSESLLQDQARLAALQTGPTDLKPFTSWSYLQSPEPPISRQSPRLPLLMVMWGLVGTIIGAGVALSQREKRKE